MLYSYGGSVDEGIEQRLGEHRVIDGGDDDDDDDGDDDGDIAIDDDDGDDDDGDDGDNGDGGDEGDEGDNGDDDDGGGDEAGDEDDDDEDGNDSEEEEEEEEEEEDDDDDDDDDDEDSVTLMDVDWNSLEESEAAKNLIIRSAVENGDIDTNSLRLMLEANSFDINFKNESDGNTLLISAVSAGHLDIAEALLGGKDIDINWQGQFGCTALVWAARLGHQAFIRRIFELFGQAVDVNKQTRQHYTAVHVACMYNQPACAMIILDNSLPYIDLSACDANGNNVFMMACSQGLTPVALALLVRPGLDVNVHNLRGDTALLLSLYGQNSEIVEELLKNKQVDRGVIGYYERNALQIARFFTIPKIVKRIEEMDRGDNRLPFLLVHEHYLRAGTKRAVPGNEALHPGGSAVFRALVIRGIVHHIARYIYS